ncbi:hypothetical protein Golob_026352 [Gossypium lobatum]|uniref:Anion-transporting ATPase-like domain-containing protein n=1 Tax=Gossypium lobatum TaxID=34289 RepID=A0A7J8LUY1_9ROSI|nr:hypothetical protein [Gossypium lobatum]
MSSVLVSSPVIFPLSNSKSKSSLWSPSRRTISQLSVNNGDDIIDSSSNTPRLITFLGKGGSGKTISSVFAAQHYAMAGLSTCLVLQGQDRTADCLLNCKIDSSPTLCTRNLSVVRLETTKMLLEPLNELKKADGRLNLTQGVLEGVVGEELGVLPGMDSIFSLLALVRLLGLFGKRARKNHQNDKFDIIIYDGISTEETLRMIGASSKARLYLKYLRSMAEKTDLGRLAGPSLLRLVDEAMGISGNPSQLTGTISAEIWDSLERILEVGGAFAIPTPHLDVESVENLKKNLYPLPFACIPNLAVDSPQDWNAIMMNNSVEGARGLLSLPASQKVSSVIFDTVKKTATLLMPGFEKSEIKLYQYRGGSELLVEAGDQRRVISLPPQMQGKVGGAKFIERSLVITIR